jgi:hypothetical protein
VPAGIERADFETDYFEQYGVQCTIGCSRFTFNRETENVGRMAEKLGSR